MWFTPFIIIALISISAFFLYKHKNTSTQNETPLEFLKKDMQKEKSPKNNIK